MNIKQGNRLHEFICQRETFFVTYLSPSKALALISQTTSMKSTSTQLNNFLPTQSLQQFRCVLMSFCITVASYTILLVTP